MDWRVLVGGLTALIAVAVLLGVRRVPSGQTYTVHRLGRFHRTLAPGLHWVIPGIDRVRHKVSMLGRVVGVRCPALATRDGQRLSAEGAIYFQVLDPRRAAGRLGTLDDAAERLAQDAVGDTVEQLDAAALEKLSSSDLNAWLLGRLNDGAVQWGVRITRIELSFAAEDQDRGTGEGRPRPTP